MENIGLLLAVSIPSLAALTSMCVMFLVAARTPAALCGGGSSRLSQNADTYCAVRPVVTLKSNVIDINTDYDTEKEWKLK